MKSGVRSRLVLLIFIVSFLLCCGIVLNKNIIENSNTNIRYPGETWDVIGKPELAGWSTEKLQLANQRFNETGATALMIVDDGLVIAKWGDTKQRILCHSVRKSFLNALYGIFISKNKIDPQKTLKELGIDDKQGLTDQEKQAKIEDLLKSRSGVYHPAAYEPADMKKMRPKRGSHPSGSHWFYNNWDFNALGTIFEQETSLGIFESFYKYIAAPIEMEDFRVTDGTYIHERSSIHPAYPFQMSTRDRARFGLLYLRKGRWNGKQIIPQEWIEKSTMQYSQDQFDSGYGYMWWVYNDNKYLDKRIKGKIYSAEGSWGQYIVVIPETKLVIVQSSRSEIVWKSDKSTGDGFGELLAMILDAKKF